MGSCQTRGPTSPSGCLLEAPREEGVGTPFAFQLVKQWSCLVHPLPHSSLISDFTGTLSSPASKLRPPEPAHQSHESKYRDKPTADGHLGGTTGCCCRSRVTIGLCMHLSLCQVQPEPSEAALEILEPSTCMERWEG